MDNNNTLIIIGVIVAILVIAGLVLAWMRYRTERLRSQFGPEYVRTVEEAGGQRQAEAQLQDRAARVRKYDLKPLAAADRERFADDWRRVQAKFVDDPAGAARDADSLLGEVMSARGYPMADIDQRLEDVSVDHSEAVQNYRLARDIFARHGRGDAGTEDLRQAMINYRTLFQDLLGEPDRTPTKPEAEVRYA